MIKRDLISIQDLNIDEIKALIKITGRLKKEYKKGDWINLLEKKTLGLIFHKPSARTRISFEVGMFQLGGHSIVLSESEIGFGKRESINDLGRLFSRYLDAVVIRTYSHAMVEELAQWSNIPIINGLTDFAHPCQVISDLYTLSEYHRDIRKLKIVYIGDGNNVCNSWLFAAALWGLDFTHIYPEGFGADKSVLEYLRLRSKNNKSFITLTHDLYPAIKNADVIYTDVWASMGQEKEIKKRIKIFKSYQINNELIAQAKKSVLVMHCLPAHRGQEITDSVIDGKNSIVFEQAENRLHTQKAILLWLLRPDLFNKLMK